MLVPVTEIPVLIRRFIAVPELRPVAVGQVAAGVLRVQAFRLIAEADELGEAAAGGLPLHRQPHLAGGVIAGLDIDPVAVLPGGGTCISSSQAQGGVLHVPERVTIGGRPAGRPAEPQGFSQGGRQGTDRYRYYLEAGCRVADLGNRTAACHRGIS